MLKNSIVYVGAESSTQPLGRGIVGSDDKSRYPQWSASSSASSKYSRNYTTPGYDHLEDLVPKKSQVQPINGQLAGSPVKGRVLNI
jgi:hypothetical protein